jgi:hypothetical protein
VGGGTRGARGWLFDDSQGLVVAPAPGRALDACRVRSTRRNLLQLNGAREGSFSEPPQLINRLTVVSSKLNEKPSDTVASLSLTPLDSRRTTSARLPSTGRCPRARSRAEAAFTKKPS